MTKRPRILVVDDAPVQRESVAVWLAEDGYTVETAGSGAAVVIITAYATVDTAVKAMKEGAQEYLVKPRNPNELSLIVQRILRVKNLQRENVLLRKRLTKQYDFYDMLSKNPTMGEIFDLVRNVSGLKSTVLTQGESGTGKEMVARAIHSCSDRKDQPFVGVPCTALAESLLESELFGHERGAFTGALDQRKGKFEQAHGGTILLDEIGDISSKLQSSFYASFRRSGSTGSAAARRSRWTSASSRPRM